MKTSNNQLASKVRNELSPAHLKQLSLLRSFDKRGVALATLRCWILAATAIALTLAVSWWLAPLTGLLLVSQMMSLNNILHEVSHHVRRLSKWQKVLVDLFIAYPMCQTLNGYTNIHALHHRYTGNQQQDPDHININHYQSNKGWLVFWLNLTRDPARVANSMFGEFMSKDTSIGLYRFWFALVLTASLVPFGWSVLVLWCAAKLLGFHPIFTLREMMDHQYLKGKEVLSITRNIQGNALLQALFHPYNDNWHLVHHFLPTIPNQKSEQAHRILSNSKTYRCLENCDGYVIGNRSLLKRWTFSK
ncbi:MAG: fatty acid desaturase [Pseudomonadales bacterium]|nr:fatty acid desaturase [Pseudomonadales bacterium]